jgi:hypothetical protein
LDLKIRNLTFSFFILGLVLGSTTYAEQKSCAAVVSHTENSANQPTILQEVSSALTKTLLHFEATGNDWFTTDAVVASIHSGQSFFELIDPYYIRTINLSQSKVEPVSFSIATIDHNAISKTSLTLYKHNLFYDGYFFATGLTNHIATKLLTRTQPWLEYNPDKQNYVIHEDGAQKQLMLQLADLQDKAGYVTIYRGLTEHYEPDIIRALNLLNQNGQLNSAQLKTINKTWNRFKENLRRDFREDRKKEILKAHNQDLENLTMRISKISNDQQARAQLALEITNFIRKLDYALGRDAVFCSTSIEVGKKWGEKGLAKFRVPYSVFKALSDNDEIYVGIEGDQIEIALISARAQEYFLNGSTLDQNFRWKSPRAD